MAQALDLTQKILRGTYRYSNGEEQIVLEDGKYVKINFSSSGQQECVWILNLLFYYLVQQKEILFIKNDMKKLNGTKVDYSKLIKYYRRKLVDYGVIKELKNEYKSEGKYIGKIRKEDRVVA